MFDVNNVLTPMCSVEKSYEKKTIKKASFNPALPDYLKIAGKRLGLPFSSKGIPLTFSDKPYDNHYGIVEVYENFIIIYGENEEAARLALGYLDQLYLIYDGKIPCSAFFFEKPVSGYRGFHLDCCRHFFTVNEIKRLLKTFSVFGFNIFHWHLTDDQGWRFSVPGYPKLKSVASKRASVDYKDGRMYGGFYENDDLRAVVKYASDLGITVIPEIETPGHAVALLAAYPEFGCTGNKIEVETSYGIFEDVMNPASEKLWVFLDKAVAKLASIFPGPYIHIGGDECPHVQWENHPECRAIMEQEGLKDTMELQGWFTSKMARLVANYGKRAMGWDEVVDAPEIDKSVIVMSWRGLNGAIKATSRGHNVILCPEAGGGCYFDRYYTSDDWEPGNLSLSPLKNVFDLDFSMEELPEDCQKLIMGGQGNMWTEVLRSGRAIEYMYFPRALALAENLWLGKNRDWKSFEKRRMALYKVLIGLDMTFSTARWVD